MKNNYETYSKALKLLNMDSLDLRRDKMNLSFAKKCLKIDNMKSLFPLKNTRDTRKKSKFIVNKSKSERYRALIWYWDHLKNFIAEIPQGPSEMSIGTIWVTQKRSQ